MEEKVGGTAVIKKKEKKKKPWPRPRRCNSTTTWTGEALLTQSALTTKGRQRAKTRLVKTGQNGA